MKSALWAVLTLALFAVEANADCKTANGWPAGKQCQPAANVGVRIGPTDKSLQEAIDAGEIGGSGPGGPVTIGGDVSGPSNNVQLGTGVVGTNEAANLDAGDTTAGQFANGRISAASVEQHEAALEGEDLGTACLAGEIWKSNGDGTASCAPDNSAGSPTLDTVGSGAAVGKAYSIGDGSTLAPTGTGSVTANIYSGPSLADSQVSGANESDEIATGGDLLGPASNAQLGTGVVGTNEAANLDAGDTASGVFADPRISLSSVEQHEANIEMEDLGTACPIGEIAKSNGDGTTSCSVDSTGGTPDMGSIQNGTSTGKTLVVGNGSTLAPTGTGAITANVYSGPAVSDAQVSGAGEADEIALGGDASGTAAAVQVNEARYTPSDNADWGGADPGNVKEAVEHLVNRRHFHGVEEMSADYIGNLSEGVLYKKSDQSLTIYTDPCDMLNRPMLDSTGVSPVDNNVIAHFGGAATVGPDSGFDFGPARYCFGMIPTSVAVNPATTTHVDADDANADLNYPSGHDVEYVFHSASVSFNATLGSNQTEPWIFAKWGNRFFAGQDGSGNVWGNVNEVVTTRGRLRFSTLQPRHSTSIGLTAIAGGLTGTGTVPNCGTLEDTATGWSTDQWAGWAVSITGGTSSGAYLAATANDSDTLTLACKSRGKIDPVGDSATTVSVTDDDKQFHTNELVTLYRLRFISGCAAGLSRPITANTERTITVGTSFGCTPATPDEWVVELNLAPDATSVYTIEWFPGRVNSLNTATVFDSPTTVVAWWNDNMNRSNSSDFRLSIEGSAWDYDNIGLEHDFAWGNTYDGWRIKNQGIAVRNHSNMVGSFVNGYISGNAFGWLAGDQTWPSTLPFFSGCSSGNCAAIAGGGSGGSTAIRDTVIEGDPYGEFMSPTLSRYLLDNVWFERGFFTLAAAPSLGDMGFDQVSFGFGKAGAADFFRVCNTPGDNNPASTGSTVGRPGEVPLSLTCTKASGTHTFNAQMIGGNLGSDRGHEVWEALYFGIGFDRQGDSVQIQASLGVSEEGGASSAAEFDAPDDATTANLSGLFYFGCAPSLFGTTSNILLDGSHVSGGNASGMKWPNCWGIQTAAPVRLAFGMHQATTPAADQCLFAGGAPASPTNILSCSAANIGANGALVAWPMKQRMLLKRLVLNRGGTNAGWVDASPGPEDSINFRVREWYCSAEDADGLCTNWTQSQFVYGPLVVGAADLGRPVDTYAAALSVVGQLGVGTAGDRTSCTNNGTLGEECQSMIGVAVNGVTDAGSDINNWMINGYIELIPPLPSTFSQGVNP